MKHDILGDLQGRSPSEQNITDIDLVTWFWFFVGFCVFAVFIGYVAPMDMQAAQIVSACR